MDSFELNKIAGAVLATGLLVMALSITSEIIYEPEDLRENGYVIAVDETVDTHAAAGAVAEPPIAVRLQSADVARGEAAAKKCQACHTFHQGEPAKVGPNLYGIVANEAAHMPGFKYSGAMQEKSDAGMVWSYEELDRFLANPKAEVPGTMMAFAGLKKPDERADVIAYLRTLDENPPPLPEPPADATPEDAASLPPEGEAAPPAGATHGEAAPEAQGNAADTMSTPTPESTAPASSGDAMSTPPAPEATPPAGQTAQ